MNEVEQWKRKASWQLIQAFIWAALGADLLGNTVSERSSFFATILFVSLMFSFNTGVVLTNAGRSLTNKILPDKHKKNSKGDIE